MHTEIQLVLTNGQTLGWPITQEAQALAWRAANDPACEVRYITE